LTTPPYNTLLPINFYINNPVLLNPNQNPFNCPPQNIPPVSISVNSHLTLQEQSTKLKVIKEYKQLNEGTENQPYSGNLPVEV
jgi:hypothetical protein